MTRLRHRPALDVRVEIRGELPHEDAEYVRAQALDLVAGLGPGTRSARVRLTRVRDRAVTRPALAQAVAELDGAGPVRVQLAAVTAREAVDLVLGTLAGRAARLLEQGDIGFAAVHESAYRPQYTVRPLAERRIARCKPVVLGRRTTEQAAREMLALDFGFHLFADTDTGQDSLIHRYPPGGGLGLLRAVRAVGPCGAATLPISEHPDPAHRLDLAEAARQLWLTGGPFVFHTDPADGRGRVLYRRYDGHYGLITPVADGG
ncbi:HPF/RaiA family ribosome-associated protein [Streptomyces kaniharaensis]|uniref:HPF/RaiA family ribosome-associated protein n=1 Tax=Streptomyces kaniharaensis TaxID=212423 RepID=A0A6N7L5Q5_9ACTN|nr:sigma 54 modulation/S30EA ribosomal C-terminal domain-containing protein [Streptomyces kaniharaensis]MQS17744.1 HPF/RaiA family ribosome-associated protein [Streptomyces kaniharaensis]